MEKFFGIGSFVLGTTAFVLSLSNIAGCGPRPFDGGAPVKMENVEIKYTQDKLGFCYAFVDNLSAFGFHQVSLAYVPCQELQARLQAVQEAQKKQAEGAPIAK